MPEPMLYVAVDAIDGVAAALPFLRSPGRYRPHLLTAAAAILALTGRFAALHPAQPETLGGTSHPTDHLVRPELLAQIVCLRDRLADAARSMERLVG